jgi:hypothetical protein
MSLAPRLRRAILSALGRDRLVELADHFDVAVPDRRSCCRSRRMTA